jgi:hypothetical protein
LASSRQVGEFVSCVDTQRSFHAQVRRRCYKSIKRCVGDERKTYQQCELALRERNNRTIKVACPARPVEGHFSRQMRIVEDARLQGFAAQPNPPGLFRTARNTRRTSFRLAKNGPSGRSAGWPTLS